MRSKTPRNFAKTSIVLTIFGLFLRTSVSLAQGQGSYPDYKQQVCNELVSPIPEVDPKTQGKGVDFNKINIAAALPACKDAARNSDPHYMGLYGTVLRSARLYAEAIKELRKAAEEGDGLAMLNLGEAYRLGQGVRPSAQDALSWYRKAGDAGIAFASAQVGDWYFTGAPGVPLNYAEAAIWYRKAAD
jgi:TPR repeat protein